MSFFYIYMQKPQENKNKVYKQNSQLNKFTSLANEFLSKKYGSR